MDSETHFSIVFNIYGGSNQILPNATSATQNYYGDEAELRRMMSAWTRNLLYLPRLCAFSLI